MNGKRVMKTKKPVALVAILVLLCCAVAGTVAFLVTKTDPVVNTFTPSKVTTYVDEKFEKGEKKDVCIQNTGNIDAYIRVAVIVNWADAQGNVSGTPVKDSDYTISYNKNVQADGGQWIKGSDGYWYYTKPVAPSTENNPQYTGVLINSCTQTGTAPAEGYALQVTILADGIQSEPGTTVVSVWESVIGVKKDKTLSVATN